MKQILQSESNACAACLYSWLKSEGITCVMRQRLPLFWKGMSYKVDWWDIEKLQDLVDCVNDESAKKYFLKKFGKRKGVYGVYASKRWGKGYLIVAWGYFRRL